MEFPPEYYVYILSLYETGHYYVGMTTNPISREMSHYNHIRNLLLAKKYHDFRNEFSRKKVKTEYVPDRGQKVHWFLALNILPKVNHFVYPGRTIAYYYGFKVIAKYSFVEEAITHENMLLDIGKNDKYCLNDQMLSCYSEKIY